MRKLFHQINFNVFYVLVESFISRLVPFDHIKWISNKKCIVERRKKSITPMCLINCTPLKTLIISCVIAHLCRIFLYSPAQCTDFLFEPHTDAFNGWKSKRFISCYSTWSHMCMPEHLCFCRLHANGRHITLKKQKQTQNTNNKNNTRFQNVCIGWSTDTHRLDVCTICRMNKNK